MQYELSTRSTWNHDVIAQPNCSANDRRSKRKNSNRQHDVNWKKKRVDNVACGSWFIRLGIRGVTVCETYAYIHGSRRDTNVVRSKRECILVLLYTKAQSTVRTMALRIFVHTIMCYTCSASFSSRRIETLGEPFRLDGVSRVILIRIALHTKLKR